jgi:hypothetical protein
MSLGHLATWLKDAVKGEESGLRIEDRGLGIEGVENAVKCPTKWCQFSTMKLECVKGDQ